MRTVTRTFTVLVALATAVGTASPVLAGEDRPSYRLPAAPERAERAAPVDARVGNLTFRVPDLPGTGARRLTSASVRQDLRAKRVSGTFVLDAVPTAGTTSHLRVSFGHLIDGNHCQADLEVRTSTTALASGFTRSGRTITLNKAQSEAGYEDWDCAFAALDLDTNDDMNDGSVQSVLIGALTNVYATPKLSLLKPKILGKKVGRLKLVRNQWHVVNVPVRNSGRVAATGVTVTGKGKGLKVRKARVGDVYDSFDPVAKLRVRAAGKRIGPLKLKMNAGNAATARSKVRTTIVRAPKRPAAGNYRSKAGDVSYRVKGGKKPKVTGFRVRTQTTCGGYGQIPTYTMNWYDFPTTTIGGGGIVDRIQRKELYSVSLQVKIVGGKATRGRFSYHGPNNCRAIEVFKATRRKR